MARYVVRATGIHDVRTMSICDFWTMAASDDLADNFETWAG